MWSIEALNVIRNGGNLTRVLNKTRLMCSRLLLFASADDLLLFGPFQVASCRHQR